MNADWASVRQWIVERAGTVVNVDGISGTLNTFIVEPFVPHASSDEYYVCIAGQRDGDEIMFYHEGGIDVGDVDAKAKRFLVPMRIDDADGTPAVTADALAASELLTGVPDGRRGVVAAFLAALFEVYVKLQFTYLEINPIVVTGNDKIYYLDLAAKVRL